MLTVSCKWHTTIAGVVRVLMRVCMCLCVHASVCVKVNRENIVRI